MAAVVSAMAAALVAVTFGWAPTPASEPGASAPAAGGGSAPGYDYLVQLTPEDLEALASGDVKELSSTLPAGVEPVGRVRIGVGRGALPQSLTPTHENSPRRIATAGGASQRYEVAKPTVPDWLPPRESGADTQATPKKHTVFQNPQPLDAQALTQGFSQGAGQAATGIPQSSGDPLQPIADAAQNVARATGQSLQDLGSGTRELFQGAASGLSKSAQAVGDTVGAVVGNTLNMGDPRYFESRNAGAPAAYNGAAPTQPGALSAAPYNPTAPSQLARQGVDQAAAPFYDPATGRWMQRDIYGSLTPVAQQSATDFGPPPGAQSTEPSPIARRFTEGRSDLEPVRERVGAQFAPVAESGATPDRSLPDRFDDWPAPAQQPPAGQQQTAPYSSPSVQPPFAPQPGYAATGQQGSAQVPWWVAQYPSSPPAGNTPPPYTPATGQQGAAQAYGPPPVQQQPASSPAPGGATGWGDNRQPIAQNEGIAKYDLASDSGGGSAQNGNRTTPEIFMFGVLLAASLAANLFVGTSYLDMRNKYRAVLRRGPMSLYQQAA